MSAPEWHFQQFTLSQAQIVRRDSAISAVEEPVLDGHCRPKRPTLLNPLFEQKTRDALYRCYEAADGWMFFAAPTHRGAALAEVDALKGLSSLETTALTDALAARFAQQTTAHWQRVFNGTSNAVVGLGALHQTRDDALQRESESAIDIAKATFRAIRHDQHPMGRWVDLVAPNAVRPQFSPIKIPGPAPKYGADTRHVLAQLGYSSTDVDALIHQGAAAESWSDKYLPE